MLGMTHFSQQDNFSVAARVLGALFYYAPESGASCVVNDIRHFLAVLLFGYITDTAQCISHFPASIERCTVQVICNTRVYYTDSDITIDGG